MTPNDQLMLLRRIPDIIDATVLLTWQIAVMSIMFGQNQSRTIEKLPNNFQAIEPYRILFEPHSFLVFVAMFSSFGYTIVEPATLSSTCGGAAGCDTATGGDGQLIGGPT